MTKARDVPENVYLNARRDTLERESNTIKREQTWRTIALVLAVGNIGFGYGLSVLATRPALKPYIVEVDHLGAVLPVKEADQASRPDQRVIRNQLARFVRNARTVYLDAAAAQAIAKEAYAVLLRGSSAYATVDRNFRENSPIKRAETEAVTVDVKSVLPVGGNTWRIEWVETVRDRGGTLIRTEPWFAVVTTTIKQQDEEAAIRANPIGLFIQDLSWGKQL